MYNKLGECTYCKESWGMITRFFDEKRANLKWAYKGLDEHFGFAEECYALDTSAISYHYCE